MAENKEQDKFQRKLAGSGYRLPDNFFVEPVDPQQSTERKSGDGGTAANTEQDSEHGYKGELKSQADFREEMDAERTVDPETGLTIPGVAERQARAARGFDDEDDEDENGGTTGKRSSRARGRKAADGPSENK